MEREDGSKRKRQKPVKHVDEDKDEDEDGDGGEPEADQEGVREEKSEKNAKEEEEEEEEETGEDAKPVSQPVRFSGEGTGRTSHYTAFNHNGDQYKLEDTVLPNPTETDHEPYVAIIKDNYTSHKHDGYWAMVLQT